MNGGLVSYLRYLRYLRPAKRCGSLGGEEIRRGENGWVRFMWSRAFSIFLDPNRCSGGFPNAGSVATSAQ